MEVCRLQELRSLRTEGWRRTFVMSSLVLCVLIILIGRAICLYVMLAIEVSQLVNVVALCSI